MMTRWQSELVRRLRRFFLLSHSMYTDGVVLSRTKGSWGRRYVVFWMKWQRLWAVNREPWMDE